MNEEQLKEIEELAAGVDVWYGGEDCERLCHTEVPKMVVEIRRLRELEEKHERAGYYTPACPH